MSQSDLRVIRSKQLIKEAFLDLMDENNYDKITIKAISERAIINRKTFYNHYDSIDDLLNDILLSTIEMLFIDVLPDEEPNKDSQVPDEIYKKVKRLLHNVSENKRVINIFFNNVSSHELIKQFGEQLMEKILTIKATDHLHQKFETVPVDLLGVTMTASFMTVIRWYILNSATYSEDDAAKIIMELIVK